MPIKTTLTNRLKSLNEIDDVTVKVAGNGGTIHIRHDKKGAADFIFKWADPDHFIGYFTDSDGNQSQAVVSLYTAMDAVHFAAAYSLLLGIRAQRHAA